MSTTAKEFWDRLTPDEQARRIACYDRVARRAYSHCCSILIGCARQPPAQTRSATGILVSVKARHYVITAHHVVAGLEKALLDGPAHFQVGRLVFEPRGRIAFEDKLADLAVIAVDSREAASIGCVPYEPIGSWPPPSPKDGDFVHLCGFASANRVNGPTGTIDSYSLHLFGQVMTAHDGNFYARIDRTGIPTENAALMPPPGQPLGGLSGGPVMLHFREPLPLIGVISEMSCLMDSIRVTALSAVRIRL
jgi:hypothetical protein